MLQGRAEGERGAASQFTLAAASCRSRHQIRSAVMLTPKAEELPNSARQSLSTSQATSTDMSCLPGSPAGHSGNGPPTAGAVMRAACRQEIGIRRT